MIAACLSLFRAAADRREFVDRRSPLLEGLVSAESVGDEEVNTMVEVAGVPGSP